MTQALYVHIPFCQHICSYCDFCRVGYDQGLVDRYLLALEQELKERVLTHELKTIYIGGGTPSSLEVYQLDRLFSLLQPYTKVVKEYTIEINPENMTREKVKLFCDYGINRVSIGVESMDPHLLEQMNRKHSPDDVLQTIAMISDAGIDNISIDLLYGFDDQTIADVLDTITLLKDQPIKHISLYDLMIEEHSYLKRHGIKKADQELCDEMFFKAKTLLTKLGYQQYEISNFAKGKKYRSQHNLAYWQYQDFYGIGLNASSKIGDHRYTNTSNFIDYLAGRYSDEEVINNEVDYLFERMMMGLRLKEGILLSKNEENAIICIYKNKLDDLLKQKLISFRDHRLKATAKGYRLLNEVLIALLPEN